MNFLQRLAKWLVFNIPLGRLAPYILGFALGSKPRRVRR
jgi:hypothetical protein